MSNTNNKDNNELKDLLNELKKDIVGELKNYIDVELKQRLGRVLRSENNEEEQKVCLKRGDKVLTNEDIQRLNSDYQPDLVVQTQDESIGEDKSKPKIAQKELPFFDKKSGTGTFLGATLGALVGGIPGAMLGGIVGGKASDSNNENIDKGINGITREFLENNPVKSYEEFVERLVKIYPHLTEDQLERIQNVNTDDNIKLYNTVLIKSYDKQKRLNDEKLKFTIPYIEHDFSTFVLKNNLKDILKSRGISFEKLAELIGVSRNTMTSIVNNKGTSAINMFKISLILGLPVEAIFKYQPIFEDEDMDFEEDIDF